MSHLPCHWYWLYDHHSLSICQLVQSDLTVYPEMGVSTKVGCHVHGQLPRSVVRFRWSCMIHRVHVRMHKVGTSPGLPLGLSGMMSVLRGHCHRFQLRLTGEFLEHSFLGFWPRDW